MARGRPETVRRNDREPRVLRHEDDGGSASAVRNSGHRGQRPRSRDARGEIEDAVAPGCFRISDRRALAYLGIVLARLPTYSGRLVRVKFRPDLTVRGGKLLSRGKVGNPVHAGSELRARQMVLDSDLLKHPFELERIFIHEIHHFVWVRLGNWKRRRYEDLLAREFHCRARGELGWSAESLKRELSEEDVVRRTRRWREYVCESFCDAAAWLYSRARGHDEWTLSRTRCAARERILRNLLAGGDIQI